MKKLKPHRLAGLLPAMTGQEYASLKSDIASHGCREPVVLLDGKILDGRHRYRACVETKRRVPTRRFNPSREGEPLDYLHSKALHRNLTDSQRAALAVTFEERYAALAAESQHQTRFGSKARPAPTPFGKARDRAGEMFGVSGKYVGNAKSLRRLSPGLFDDVLAGRVSLSKAMRLVKVRKLAGVRVVVLDLAEGTSSTRTYKAATVARVLSALKRGGLR